MPGARGIRDEMQKVSQPQPRAYGAPLGAPDPSSAANRPVPGAAPPDVQRRALAAHEAQSAREARAGLYQKPVGSQAAPSSAAVNPNTATAPSRDLSVLGAAQQIQERPAQINQAVEAAGG